MTIFSCMKQNFSNWLKLKLDEKKWSPSDLARVMKKNPATVHRILNEDRGIGNEVCRDIAEALELPQHIVFYHAGLLTELPTDDNEDERMKRIQRKMKKLTDDELDRLEKYVDCVALPSQRGKKAE